MCQRQQALIQVTQLGSKIVLRLIFPMKGHNFRRKTVLFMISLKLISVLLVFFVLAFPIRCWSTQSSRWSRSLSAVVTSAALALPLKVKVSFSFLNFFPSSPARRDVEGCNPERHCSNDSEDRIFRTSTNHSRARIRPCADMSPLRPDASRLVLLFAMIHMGAHCILSPPSYPYPTQPYKLCTSYPHRKSACTSPILPIANIHVVSMECLRVAEAVSILGKLASYTALS